MDVRLDRRGEELVERELRAGRFHSREEVVARALEKLAGNNPAPDEEAKQAVKDMLDFAGKHHFTLGQDLKIRDLLHAAHKY